MPAKHALVTITCDPALPLEQRVELLSYAFTRAVKGSALHSVLSWDIAHGSIVFIIAPLHAGTNPRGAITARMQDVEQIAA